MFSQRKSFWKRRWFILTVIAIIGAGYWFSQTDRFSGDADPIDGDQINQPVDSRTKTGDNVQQQQDQDGDLVSEPGQPEEQGQESFFLIKENSGTIEIYYYEGAGDPIFIRNADIAFSLLSEGDQSMFSEGIIVETEEELDELLQDFGS